MPRPKFKVGDLLVNQNDEHDLKQITSIQKGSYHYCDPRYDSTIDTATFAEIEEEYRRQKKNNEWYRKMAQLTYTSDED